MARDMTMAPFIKSLNAAGWHPDYDSRAGGERCAQFSYDFGKRHVEVQLWGGGRHRATHLLNGRMSTHPTTFMDVPAMWEAVDKERTRKDHPPAIPMNGYGCAGPCNGKDATCRYPKCIRAIDSGKAT